MTKQVIQIGTVQNDRTGDPIRTAFNKVNQNFTELYDSRTNLPAEFTLTIHNLDETTGEQPGALHVLGGATVEKSFTVNDMLHVGNGAVNNNFLNPVIVAKRAGSTYVQIALINSDGHGSADSVVYADNGTEEQGWCDMGMTGSVFDDPNYTITEEGEGYIFVQGSGDDISHGSLVLCTGNLGLEKSIIFGTGGFMHENMRMELSHPLQRLEIFMDTQATAENPGSFYTHGGAQIDKDLIVQGDMYIGVGGTQHSLENTIISARKSHPQYITFGVINSNDSGSADIIAQANSGTAEFGWVDMGFCGSTFNDPNYTITGPGDAYVFAAGFGDGNSNGNLVIATGSYGNALDLVFATGGYTAANERMRYVHATKTFNVKDNLKVGGKVIAGTQVSVGGVASNSAIAIDLAKSISKLGSGYHTLADGIEGQTIQIVRQTGVTNSTTCKISVANARVAGVAYTNKSMDPFSSTADIITFIFTDGAWQSTGGVWN